MARRVITFSASSAYLSRLLISLAAALAVSAGTHESPERTQGEANSTGHVNWKAWTRRLPTQTNARGTPGRASSVSQWPVAGVSRDEAGRGPPLQQGHVVVSMHKGESEFVVEWINYHLWLGFDHIFIYYQDDDGAGIRRQLRHFVQAGVLTLTHWGVSGDQKGAYKAFMQGPGMQVESLLFLDADEFVVLCKHPSIRALYADVGFATPSTGGKALCMAFSWFHFGTSDLPTHPYGTAVMTQYFKRAADIDRRMFGKVAVAGGGAIQREPVKHFWHHCFAHGFQLGRQQSVLGDENVVRLHHYRLRYGEESLMRRVKRGAAGDFAGQAKFASKSVAKYSDWNAVTDRTLLGILGLIPDLMAAKPTGFRKENLAEGEFKCDDRSQQ